MFDTIYVSDAVASAWGLRCRTCGRVPAAATEGQTKSLDSSLYTYFVRYDASDAVRLYLLDRPSDRRHWRPWTEEEIAESERLAERGGLFSFWRKKSGEGCFLPEAYLPENRRQRFMGELPHQWVEIHARCACGEFMEHWIKFCEGVATDARSEAPRQEPGFFDDAGGLEP